MAGLADAEGHLTKTYRYGVTGELTYGSATYENEYTYNGESYNPNIQSQYLRARYYNVVTANFLTEDSYLGNINQPLTLNRYNYCTSNYLNYVDSSGHIIGTIIVTSVIIGATIDLVCGTISEVEKYNRTEEYDWAEGATNVLIDVAAGSVGGLACALNGGNPIAIGVTAGITHGLLDSLVHVDKNKSLKENLYNIGYQANVEGFYGGVYGLGWSTTGKLTGGMGLSQPLNIFLQGVGGNALASSLNRYISGKDITAETIVDDAYSGGLMALAAYGIGCAVQDALNPVRELPEGYIRNRAKLVEKLNASEQCDVKILYRGERAGMTPDIVFEKGFIPNGTHEDALLHTQSNSTRGNFVSTSSEQSIAIEFAGKNGYVYVIKTNNYVDINNTYGEKTFFPEQMEFSVPSGIKPSEIVGAYKKQGGVIVDYIPNPNYGGQ